LLLRLRDNGGTLAGSAGAVIAERERRAAFWQHMDIVTVAGTVVGAATLAFAIWQWWTGQG
jgi:hypothetical protein